MTMRALCDRALALVIALAVLAAFALPARAQSFDAALAGFATDSYADTETAIVAVASSGNAMAAPVIEALLDGRLMFDATTKKIYVKEKSGRLLDAVTGKPAAGDTPAGLAAVRAEQPHPPHHRRRHGHADPDGARSGQADRGRAVRAAFARCNRVAGAGNGARQGDRRQGQTRVTCRAGCDRRHHAGCQGRR